MSGRESVVHLRRAYRQVVNSHPGGRLNLGASSTSMSVAALTTCPSGAPGREAPKPVQAKVETRTRVPKPTKEETKNTETTAALIFGRPCLGLDVHRSSITATPLDPGGRVVRSWTFPTTRQSLLGPIQEVMVDVPIVLEASTAGKAVASLRKEGGRELHGAAPNKVALIAKALA